MPPQRHSFPLSRPCSQGASRKCRLIALRSRRYHMGKVVAHAGSVSDVWQTVTNPHAHRKPPTILMRSWRTLARFGRKVWRSKDHHPVRCPPRPPSCRPAIRMMPHMSKPDHQFREPPDPTIQWQWIRLRRLGIGIAVVAALYLLVFVPLVLSQQRAIMNTIDASPTTVPANGLRSGDATQSQH